jgi:putative transposase
MRKPRILVKDAKYHVMSRVNHRDKLLNTAEAKEMFLKVLRQAKEKFDFVIDNFTIMGNHFHFIIQPASHENLSKIMKWILQTFAIRYNRKHNLVGHFWCGRFVSWVINSFTEFLHTFVYIDKNPVTARLVQEPCDWIWGALWQRRHGDYSIVDAIDSSIEQYFLDHLLTRG